jgi:hypothetical protein
MKTLASRWSDMDRRAGYQRQEREPVAYNCECGAHVVKRFGEFHHVGPCSIVNGSIPAWTKREVKQ